MFFEFQKISKLIDFNELFHDLRQVTLAPTLNSIPFKQIKKIETCRQKGCFFDVYAAGVYKEQSNRQCYGGLKFVVFHENPFCHL